MEGGINLIMIYTSYYDNPRLTDLIKKYQLYPQIISNSFRYVKNTILNEDNIYHPLVPPWYLVRAYKGGSISSRQYSGVYKEKILDSLDWADLVNDLEQTVLLCWCKPNEFCHRHLVREYLNKNGLICIELEDK